MLNRRRSAFAVASGFCVSPVKIRTPIQAPPQTSTDAPVKPVVGTTATR